MCKCMCCRFCVVLKTFNDKKDRVVDYICEDCCKKDGQLDFFKKNRINRKEQNKSSIIYFKDSNIFSL